VFLICDKGALKTSNAHFVKILAWYSKKEQRVKMFLLDCNDTDGTSDECVTAIKHALKKFFGGDTNTDDLVVSVLNRQMTDIGGDGTGKSFHKGLDELDLCDSVTSYLVGYCALHCLQLTSVKQYSYRPWQTRKEIRDQIPMHCTATVAWHIQFAKIP
jgi:hypothetical protein